MRDISFFLLGVALIALSGCSNPRSPTNRLGERTLFSWYGIRNENTNSIPLPRQTPYDYDAGARAVYLQAYWEGYHFATQRPDMGALIDSYHPQGPYAIPKEHGYSRGQMDAKIADTKRRIDEEEDAIKREREQREKDRISR